MAAAQGNEDRQSMAAAQGNEDGQSMATEQVEEDTETKIEELERIKRKGRPPKPKRFRTVIEDIKKKAVEKGRRGWRLNKKRKQLLKERWWLQKGRTKRNQKTLTVQVRLYKETHISNPKL
jgi:hypothetical protein